MKKELLEELERIVSNKGECIYRWTDVFNNETRCRFYGDGAGKRCNSSECPLLRDLKRKCK